jgi:ketosteroid isomerase-like protein
LERRLPGPMTTNKDVVATYQACLGNLDWAGVAATLTDDVERVEWADGFDSSGVPTRGKEAVVKGMEAPRKFELNAIRMTEENDVVVAEVQVRVPLDDGGTFVGRALTVYDLQDGKIKRISSFVAEDKHPT